jgi:hypothetical protein
VGVVLNCKQKCRLRVKNWLVGRWHQYLSLCSLHIRRRAVRVTDNALGVERPLCVTAGRARVTPSWDVASGAGGAVMDPAVSSA